MALNAPIQGSAADVFKLGMIRVDAGLRGSDLECRMLLTVHDELVFEVATDRVGEAAELVKREMEAAYDLEVPLRADVGWGELGRGGPRALAAMADLDDRWDRTP